MRRTPPATTRAFKSEMSELRPGARHARCSTCYGYVDRDGDGWREQPDGKPLVLEYATAARRRPIAQFDELWNKNMKAHRHPHGAA